MRLRASLRGIKGAITDLTWGGDDGRRVRSPSRPRKESVGGTVKSEPAPLKAQDVGERYSAVQDAQAFQHQHGLKWARRREQLQADFTAIKELIEEAHLEPSWVPGAGETVRNFPYRDYLNALSTLEEVWLSVMQMQRCLEEFGNAHIFEELLIEYRHYAEAVVGPTIECIDHSIALLDYDSHRLSASPGPLSALR